MRCRICSVIFTQCEYWSQGKLTYMELQGFHHSFTPVCIPERIFVMVFFVSILSSDWNVFFFLNLHIYVTAITLKMPTIYNPDIHVSLKTNLWKKHPKIGLTLSCIQLQYIGLDLVLFFEIHLFYLTWKYRFLQNWSFVRNVLVF